jgi:putative DNA primase/helicase
MTADRLSAHDVHVLIANRWSEILERLGIEDSFLNGRHGPCPMCGGRDRWRFSNYRGRGDWICNGCGSGDGFDLLQRVLGWGFAEAIRAVIDAAALRNVGTPQRSTLKRFELQPAQPSERIRRLLRESLAPSSVFDVVKYLRSRRVWPLPDRCVLRAHPEVDYFDDDGVWSGRFPALLAPITDIDGELVSLQATWLHRGRKLVDHDARKTLGRLTARRGCAVRLAPATDVLGVAEGVETALAAMRLHHIPTWATTGAPLLGRFEPPVTVERLVIFADRNDAGRRAAEALRDRFGRCDVEVRTPDHAKDWNDVLIDFPTNELR